MPTEIRFSGRGARPCQQRQAWSGRSPSSRPARRTDLLMNNARAAV